MEAPKMLYTLGLKQDFGDVHYRFQTDGSWRMCDFFDGLDSSDYSTSDAEAVKQRVLPGVIYPVGQRDLYATLFGAQSHRKLLTFHHIGRVFRRSLPNVPELDQLEDTLRSGNNSSWNQIVLTTQGTFQLRSPGLDVVADPSVAVHYLPFPSYGTFVGEGKDKMSSDPLQMYNLFEKFMGVWYDHLETGEANLRIDPNIHHPLQETMSVLDDLMSAWKPEF